MKIDLLLLALLILLINAASTCASDRALLVGVENYQDERVPPTPGCVKDALETAEFIKTKYGFDAANIKLLINEQATSINIVQQFREWLIQGTKPGERVFFLYAGHGSQLPDDNGDELVDHLDETLAPYDVNPRTGGNEIRDDIFAQLIAQLSGRRAVLVFDSCHSGSISREISAATRKSSPTLSRFPRGGGARYLPTPEQFNNLLKVSDSRGIGNGYVVENSGRALVREHGFVSEEKTGKLSGVVIISAASDTQQAYPLEVNGSYRGALSYAFVESQKDSNKTLSDIKGLIAEFIDKLQKSGKLGGNQVPRFEVLSVARLDDQPLFGAWEQAPAVALANPLSPIRIGISTREGKKSYKVGEEVSYKVTTDSPGFLYLLVFSPQNTATCIFPNKEDANNQIVAGTHLIPRGEYSFPVMEPVGRDVVVAVISKVPLRVGELNEYSGDEVFKLYTWDQIFARLNLKKLQEAVTERAIGVRKTQGELTDADWQSAVLVLQTQK